MDDGLDALLASLRHESFPDSVERGADYGLVDVVLIDADLHGWSTRVSSGDPLDALETTRFRDAADRLAASIVAMPRSARVYFSRRLLAAEVALRRIERE